MDRPKWYTGETRSARTGEEDGEEAAVEPSATVGRRAPCPLSSRVPAASGGGFWGSVASEGARGMDEMRGWIAAEEDIRRRTPDAPPVAACSVLGVKSSVFSG